MQASVTQESGPDCPAQRAIAMIADKWKLLILFELGRTDVLRFKELQRTIGTITQKVLTGALRELERDGLVERRIYAEVPPRVEYRATKRARSLFPILAQLHAWADENGASAPVSLRRLDHRTVPTFAAAPHLVEWSSSPLTPHKGA